MRLIITEKWSKKYKRSINCDHPKGFSQRAHCQGRKKHEGINRFVLKERNKISEQVIIPKEEKGDGNGS